MKTLNHKDRIFWQENGYVLIPNVVPAENLAAAIDAIAEFTGKNLEDKRSWYQEPMVLGGMINMTHHQALWDNRQSQIVHQAFSEIWENEKLWVTFDRANMNPPTNNEWDHEGFIHWDLDTTMRPIELCVQGVLYLNDTTENQGGFQCVPKSHHRLIDWGKTHSSNHHPTQKEIMNGLDIISVPGNAGDLLIWHSALLHGNGQNTSDTPRFAQYIGMQPEWTERTHKGVVTGNEQTRQSRMHAWKHSPYQRVVADSIGVPEGLIEQWLRYAREKIDVVVEVDSIVESPKNGSLQAVINGKKRRLPIIEQIKDTEFRVQMDYANREKLPYQKQLTDRAIQALKQIPQARFKPLLTKTDLEKLSLVLAGTPAWGATEIAKLITDEFGLNHQLEPAQLSQLGRRLVGIELWDTDKECSSIIASNLRT